MSPGAPSLFLFIFDMGVSQGSSQIGLKHNSPASASEVLSLQTSAFYVSIYLLVMLWVKARALHVLGKHSLAELQFLQFLLTAFFLFFFFVLQ